MPDIFRMPTIGEQLGPSLDQLGSSISHMINPNREIQLQLRQSLAQNPELLQKLVDLGPDKVSQIFGKQAKFLGQGQISQEEQQKRDTQTMYNSDPIFKAEKMAHDTGTKTAEERKIQSLDITGKETSNKMNASQLKVQQDTENAQIQNVKDLAAATNIKITQTQQAIAKYPDLSSIDVGQLARRMANGQDVDPTMLKRLSDAGVNFGEIVNSLQQQAQISASFSLESLRRHDKTTQAMALAPLEKMADDSRNMILQYDGVIKSNAQAYKTAKIVLGGKTAKDSPFYAQALNTVKEYDNAVKGRDDNIKEYNLYNEKRKGLLNQIYDVKTKGADGKVEAPPDIGDVAPVDVQPYIEAAKSLSPKDLQSFLSDFQKKDPTTFDKVSPYLKVSGTVKIKGPAGNIMDLIGQKAQDTLAKNTKKPFLRNPGIKMDTFK